MNTVSTGLVADQRRSPEAMLEAVVTKNYLIQQKDNVPGVPCPCGTSCHRAVGGLHILNIAIPAFDTADELFD